MGKLFGHVWCSTESVRTYLTDMATTRSIRKPKLGTTTARGPMTTVIHIQGKLVWKWCLTKQGNYIAICDAMAATVQASKFRELLESIDEALESTFRDLFSTGDLEKFLQERGWSSDLPPHRSQRHVRFEMPFDLKGVRKRDREEALCS